MGVAIRVPQSWLLASSRALTVTARRLPWRTNGGRVAVTIMAVILVVLRVMPVH